MVYTPPVFYYFIVQYFEEEICLDENAGLKDIILTFFLLNELSGACLEGFMEYFRVAFEDNSDLSVLCIPPLLPSNSYPSIPHCISLMFKADSSKCCSWWPGPTRSIWPGLVAHLPLLGREARLTFPHRPDLHRLQVSVPPGPASPLRKPSVQPVAFRRSNRLDGNHNAL